jgi:sn-glycerol 3-phosphate transport system ATP-binding protein
MVGVTLRGVSKSFGQTKVLHEIDAEIPAGAFAVLVGPSGCGKSTLLRLIAGLEEVTTGTIQFGDRDVTSLAPRDRDLAMVFQSYALYPHMTVRENLAFGLRLRKEAAAVIEARVDEAAKMLGLEKLLERHPRALSGGQRQRVAMGRAIVREPAVFLFDEPLSNLDAKLRVQMRFEIQKLHRRLGTTALYVTHDQVEAMTLAQRMIVMNAGRAEQIGTPMEVYENPATQFVAGFIGSPSMNFVPGRVEGGGRVALAHGGVAATISSAASQAGRDVVVGIRPEHLVPGSAAEAVVSGTVEMVEQLGADMLIHVTHGPHMILARVPHGVMPGIGSTMHFGATPASVFLFDAQGGARLP